MATLFPPYLFDADWYLQQNPDVAEAVVQGLITAEDHFRAFGIIEGRASGPLFNPADYIAANPDVAEAIQAGLTTAYDHFLYFGMGEGRSPIGLFDPEFYLQQNPDVAAAVEAGLINAVEHFMLFGQNEPRQINPFVNLSAYLDANEDLAAAYASGHISPLTHLLTHGVAEGRDLGNGIDLSVFAGDPAFQQAVSRGDFQAAFERVQDVAPFLPSFQPPAGWEPPADTLIPVDFVPLDDVKLVVPGSVNVPEGMALPDTFEQPPAPTPPQPEPAPEPEPSPSPDPAPAPSPRPRPDPHPEPDPDYIVEPPLIGVAGKPSGENGKYQEGDVLILAFEHLVMLELESFDEAGAGKLGKDFNVEAISYKEVWEEWPDWLQEPNDAEIAVANADDDNEFELNIPSQHFRITLGESPSLRAGDTLTLHSFHIWDWQEELDEDTVEFQAPNTETMVLAGPLWEAFLARDVNYQLYGDEWDSNFVALPNLKLGDYPNRTIVGSDGEDYFIAVGAGTLSEKLTLDGGDGYDFLMVGLDDTDTLKPHVTNVERFEFEALNPDVGNYTFSFANVSGVEVISYFNSDAGLAVVDVPAPVWIAASGVGWTLRCVDYMLQYSSQFGMGVGHITQQISLSDSNINALSITKGGVDQDDPVSANIESLNIGISGENSISRFFQGEAAASYDLQETIDFIYVHADVYYLDDDFEAAYWWDTPSLQLGQVWDGLTIDIAGLRGAGSHGIDLDLSPASIGEDDVLTITMSDIDFEANNKFDIPGSRQSDLAVKLMSLDGIGDGATINIQNLTIASAHGSEDGPTQNDEVDLTDWCLSDADDLVQHVRSITVKQGQERGDNWYVDFVIEVDKNGHFDAESDTFFLSMDSVMSLEVYQHIISNIDGANLFASESALDIDEDIDVFDWADDKPSAGLIGLIDVFVDGGTFIL